jgi:hypothetical protein
MFVQTRGVCEGAHIRSHFFPREASPAINVTRTKRQIQDVTRHRLASHPAVASLEPSIAIAIATTDIGAPGNSTTMPRIENHAAVPRQRDRRP